MAKYSFKGHLASLINHSFQTMLILYLILLLLEQIRAGFVSAYLDLNYLLAIVIVLGILDVFSEHNFIVKKPNWFDYVFVAILGIAGFGIIKYKTFELGGLSWVISLIAGVLIILLSVLILSEDKKEEIKYFKKATKNPIAYYVLWIVILVLVLNFSSILLNIFTNMNYFESLRIVFGSVYVLFLPGFIISFIFFPKTQDSDAKEEGEKGSIDWIERIALSFALSISIIPLAVFYLNLIGIKINAINVSFIVLGVIAVSLAILAIKIKRRNKH